MSADSAKVRATAFVVLGPSLGYGGPRIYGNAFLPAVYQGTAIGRAGVPAPGALAGAEAERMQKLLDVLEDLDDVQAVYHNAQL